MKLKSILLFALIAALLVACSGRDPAPLELPTATEAAPTATTAPTNTPAPTATATEEATEAPPTATLEPQDFGPTGFPEGVNPLTGLPVADPDILDRRPVSVKIQMFPRGQRPPWGISQADIVFDYYQNNGLTRLHAIFYGNNVEQAGPIRSARLLDGYLVNMYNTILAFGGADARILERLFSGSYAGRLVMEGSSNCPPMCRIEPNGPNYLVTDTEALTEYAVSKNINNDRPKLEGMKFSHETPEGGEAGTQVFNRFSISAYNRWDFDEDTGRYLRFQDTQEDTSNGEAFTELVDQNNNEQIAADNVVVLFVTHEQIYRSASGNSEIVDIKLDTSGEGIAFRDGQAYPVQWTRTAPDAPLSITYENGDPYDFKPGQTWFEIMGQTSVQTSEAGVWRFEWRIP